MRVKKRQTGKRLDRNADVLSYLLRAQPKIRRSIIEGSTKDVVDTLCECILNVINGNVPVTAQQKRQLIRHKSDLRKLVTGRVNLTEKKRVLQKGGFFPILAKVLAPVVGSLLGGLFGGQD
jgi:hypothetical protein